MGAMDKIGGFAEGIMSKILNSRAGLEELNESALNNIVKRSKGGVKASQKASNEAWALESLKRNDPYAGIASTVPERVSDGSLGLADVLKKGASGQNYGKSMLFGAGVMGTGAALGSAFYGTASVAMPNNAEVNNPLKNFTKAVGMGIAGGALFAASRGLGAESLSKMVKPESASLFGKIQAGANFTKGALDNKLVIGAIGAATLAGSGDLNLTKPVNPVY